MFHRKQLIFLLYACKQLQTSYQQYVTLLFDLSHLNIFTLFLASLLPIPIIRY